jgi:hypothetical protein
MGVLRQDAGTAAVELLAIGQNDVAVESSHPILTNKGIPFVLHS